MIDEIKDIKKLKSFAKQIHSRKTYLTNCCDEVGERLSKHTFKYDGNPSTLSVMAYSLNEILDMYKKENELLTKALMKILELHGIDMSLDDIKQTSCEECNIALQALKELKKLKETYEEG